MTKEEHAALKAGDKVYCCHLPGGTWTVREVAVSFIHPWKGPILGNGPHAYPVNAGFWHVSPLAAIEDAIEGQHGILNSLMEQVNECHRSLDKLRALRQELEVRA